MQIPRDWLSGVHNESAKNFQRRLDSGFFGKYCAGEVVLDVGYKGGSVALLDGNVVHGTAEPRPVLPHAVGVDLDYPGYDGATLPFADESVDTVYSSHMLEHVRCHAAVLCDWWRVLKRGGHMVIIVPHKFLYERASRPPSRWNSDHRRFYSPAILLATIEEVMPPNSYRVRHLCDNDAGYDYRRGAEDHPVGAYEIECVLQKIREPSWTLAP